MSDIHLDPAVLNELKDILEGEFPVLLQTYITDSVARLAEIEAAWAANDAIALRKAAHSLKGASANLGLLLMTRHCGDIEDAARNGVLAPVPALLAVLRGERDCVENILRTYL